MALAALFGPNVTTELVLDGAETRRTIDVPRDGGAVAKLPLYQGDETVSGKITLKMNKVARLEHTGVKVELIGSVELLNESKGSFEFTQLVTELAAAGEITTDMTWPFEFKNVDKAHESYDGINVKLRYLVRFTINVRRSLNNVVKEQEFWVINYRAEPEINNSIKMEVGIEDSLHIEFEYNKSKYHLKDVVIGKIYFILAKIPIKHMEIALLRRETIGSGPNATTENETLTKFEIMDGCPVRGESIPVRLFLGGFDLTPTYRNVHSKFSLRYYLNLVLIDEADRRYFKQQEITLWRKPPGKKSSKKKKAAADAAAAASAASPADATADTATATATAADAAADAE